MKIRRRLDEFEREKRIFTNDQTSREQLHQTQLDELSAEKEYESSDLLKSSSFSFSAYWQLRLDEESDRLREQLSRLQNQYDDQSQRSVQQFETLKEQNDEYHQVGEEGILIQSIAFDIEMVGSSNGFFPNNRRITKEIRRIRTRIIRRSNSYHSGFSSLHSNFVERTTERCE